MPHCKSNEFEASNNPGYVKDTRRTLKKIFSDLSLHTKNRQPLPVLRPQYIEAENQSPLISTKFFSCNAIHLANNISKNHIIWPIGSTPAAK